MIYDEYRMKCCLKDAKDTLADVQCNEKSTTPPIQRIDLDSNAILIYSSLILSLFLVHSSVLRAQNLHLALLVTDM